MSVRDTNKERFYALLSDYYYQTKRIGNNINQVVKLFHQQFSTSTATSKLQILERDMAQIKANSEKIMELIKHFESDNLK